MLGGMVMAIKKMVFVQYETSYISSAATTLGSQLAFLSDVGVCVVSPFISLVIPSPVL
jgi:hypothetical protein